MQRESPFLHSFEIIFFVKDLRVPAVHLLNCFSSTCLNRTSVLNQLLFALQSHQFTDQVHFLSFYSDRLK